MTINPYNISDYCGEEIPETWTELPRKLPVMFHRKE
jgi:hypothetical protein